MRILLNKIKWSLRRVNISLPANALVLEVGSGGNPYPRANVLLDAYEDTRERHWELLIKDRPTIISFGENLPFKDKVFDYVIASHVLEHTPYPEKFLEELQRVARGGFIETPDAFMERINPYKDHRLEVTVREEGLIIRKKSAWIYDAELVELYEKRAKAIITRETIPRHAAEFHMRYFWRDIIKYKVLNPEVDANWASPSDSGNNTHTKLGFKSKTRSLILGLIRCLFSQGFRNANIDILKLMRCPQCHSELLVRKSLDVIACNECDSHYKTAHNILYTN